jgi:hypothetical protein
VTTTHARSTWRATAVLASFGAAGIHFGAAREHFAEFTPAGAFMLVTGVAQFAWGVAVARGTSERIVEAGLAANAGIVALWVASRTVGLPVGPMAGVPEHIHGTDLVATALEMLLIVAVISAERTTGRGGRLLVLGVLGVAATLIVGGDDPARERLAAAATLTLAAAVTFHLHVLARTLERRRSHARTPSVRPALLGLGRPARAGSGAG